VQQLMRSAAFAIVLLAACKPGSSAPLDGKVVCWGLGRSGQTGSAATSDENLPTVVPGADGVTRLFAGNSATCGLTKAGLLCWGDVGAGHVFAAPTPLAIVPGAEEIAFGNGHTCARAGGKVMCWGRNLIGQLGNGAAPDPHTMVAMKVGGDGSVTPVGDTTSLAPIETPVAVTGLTDATQLAAGGSHTCALRKGGTVVCWGGDSVGQLGDGRSGSSTTSDHPIEVTGLTDVVEIAAGVRYTCARHTAGTVDCWGTEQPQSPSGSTTGERPMHTTPAPIAGLTGARGLAIRGDDAAATLACAVIANGDVTCWDKDGELHPLLHGATQIAAGMGHLCARLASGGVSCVGANSNDELGRDMESRDPPDAPIARVAGVTQIVAGARHVCALR
jgi:alpha-tubulin suppressor-like RCC1 family protein